MADEREDACPSGVYLISPEQGERVVSHGRVKGGERLVALAGDEVSGREAFFSAIARAIPFPDYFGRNWDAVYDCLTDPSVMPESGVVLVLDGFEAMADSEPEQWAIALKVLHDACAFWKPLARELTVLLVGAPEQAMDIPLWPERCLAG